MRISKLHIALILILVAVVAFAVFSDHANHDNRSNNGTVACTTDAKICPNGTTVGRIAPDCEFAPCSSDSDDNGEIIGGQRDVYGCLSPAGYIFVESIGACARDWEIDSEDKRKAARIAVEYVGFKKGLTVSDIKILKCLGCFDIILDRKIVSLRNWEVSSVDNSKPQILDDKNDDIPVSIESDFDIKIVYGTSQSVDIAPLIKDCKARGGVRSILAEIHASRKRRCV